MTITHACGHTSQRAIRDTPRGRAYKAAQETWPCWHCRTEDDAVHARTIAERDGLPALHGSDKQITWAIAARERARATLDGSISRLVAQHHPQLELYLTAAEAIVYGQRSAGYWIALSKSRRPGDEAIMDALDDMLPIVAVVKASLHDEDVRTVAA